MTRKHISILALFAGSMIITYLWAEDKLPNLSSPASPVADSTAKEEGDKNISIDFAGSPDVADEHQGSVPGGISVQSSKHVDDNSDVIVHQAVSSETQAPPRVDSVSPTSLGKITQSIEPVPATSALPVSGSNLPGLGSMEPSGPGSTSTIGLRAESSQKEATPTVTRTMNAPETSVPVIVKPATNPSTNSETNVAASTLVSSAPANTTSVATSSAQQAVGLPAAVPSSLSLPSTTQAVNASGVPGQVINEGIPMPPSTPEAQPPAIISDTGPQSAIAPIPIPVTTSATTPQEILAEEQLEEETTVALLDTDLISIDFPGEQIRVILRNIARLYDLNLVIPETLVGTASIKLKNVTWRQIFDIVLKPVGYSFTEDGNIVRVTSIEQLNQEPMVIRTFPIKYAKASEVALALGPILQAQGGGSITVDTRANLLVIRDRPSVLQEVETMLSQSIIDRPSLQVMLEAKFLETGCAMDPEQNDVEGLGINFWGPTGLFGNTLPFVNVKGPIDFFNNMGGSTFGTAILSAPLYKMLLNALETTETTNLLASPTMVLLNNEEGKFHVGKNQPIIEANFDATTGQITVGKVNYRDIGVIVSVIPRVNAGAEQITLDIHPKVTRIVGEVLFQNIVSYPIESVRETETHVSVRNGYTLAMGGLIQDDELDKTRKVPVLGDIPGLVGRVFQNKKKRLEKINLIMFLTARVLNPDGSTFRDIIDPRQLEDIGMSDADVPGYWTDFDMPGVHKMSEEQHKALDGLLEARLRREIAYEMQLTESLTECETNAAKRVLEESEDDYVDPCSIERARPCAPRCRPQKRGF